MKKIVSLLTFTLLLAGCAREGVPGTGEALRTESLRASIVETRVEVDDLGKFSWTAGDQIAVHRSASGYETATLTEDGLFNVHLEEGEDRDAFAIYPARLADEAHSGASDLAVILPSEYTIPVDGMGTYSPVPMVAKNDPESEDLRFHHLGGLLRVSLDRVPYETQKICVNFGKRVTGSFTVANPSSAAPSISLDEGTAEDIVFTLENPVSSTASGFILNIPLPKGNYTTADIKIYDRYDNLVSEKTETFDFTIGRAQGLRGDLDLTVDVTVLPFCMKMARQGQITVKNPRGLTMEYSHDNTSWTSFNSDLTLDLDRGEIVYFRGDNPSYGSHAGYDSSYYPNRDLCTHFFSTAKCYLYGNMMSLIKSDPAEFSILTELTEPYTFSYMFDDDGFGNPISPVLCSHPSIDLVLPATTVTDFCYYHMFNLTGIDRMVLPATHMKPHCYEGMFEYCAKMKAAPELPAMELAEACYRYMFEECTGLTATPALPATTLAPSCYEGMFYDCLYLEDVTELPATVMQPYCYDSMFSRCARLKTAPVLHSTELASYCYAGMFRRTGLETAPALPASVLKDGCYGYMFEGCSSLINAPVLSATDLAENCYRYMFLDCASLVNAPVLPATELKEHCYEYMFQNCTSLVNAPALPATSLEAYCYNSMFSGCTSLVNAPDLPATILAGNCYQNMFENCSNLNHLKAMFIILPDYNMLNSWLSGVSSTGTYVKNAAATYDPKAEAGVPAGWTVETATE